MTALDQSPARALAPYLKAAILIVPQVVVSLCAVVWVRLTGMVVAGCEARCDYATSYAANVGFWFVLAGLAVLAYISLVVAERRGSSKWPVIVAGVALPVLAAFVTAQIVQSAYIP